MIARVRDLALAYDERPVLRGVSADFRAGDVTCVIGGSGSGKSSLLKCIVGLVRPTGGHAELLGVDLHRADERRRDAVLRRVGVMFQQGALFGSLTVDQNVRLPLVQHTDLPAAIVDRMVELRLAQVGLSEARHRLPAALSGGMQKRAALARASILDPEVLFCDEPSAGLDPVVSAGIDDLLLLFARDLGMSVVAVTHEVASVQRIADHVLMIDRGELIADGTLAAVRTLPDARVRAFFDRRPSPVERGGRPLLRELRP